MIESFRRGRRRRVLVAVDGSDAAVEALRWALDEAVLRRATLWVVHVWTYPSAMALPVETDVSPTTMRAHAETIVQEMIEKAMVVAEVEPEVETTIVEGDPATELLRLAGQADLLVIGARRRGTLSDLRRGSVGLRCVDHSPCPVVVVRGMRLSRDQLPTGSGAASGATGGMAP